MKTWGPKPKEFRPMNPGKYKGTLPIILRSKLELEFARWIDKNTACISWGSESIIVPYWDPIKSRQRRYFIDFHASFKTNDGVIKRFFIEIKPYRQTIAPAASSRKQEKTLLTEQRSYVTNVAKWKAATKFAESKGAKFIVVTEEDIWKK